MDDLGLSYMQNQIAVFFYSISLFVYISCLWEGKGAGGEIGRVNWSLASVVGGGGGGEGAGGEIGRVNW